MILEEKSVFDSINVNIQSVNVLKPATTASNKKYVTMTYESETSQSDNQSYATTVSEASNKIYSCTNCSATFIDPGSYEVHQTFMHDCNNEEPETVIPTSSNTMPNNASFNAVDTLTNIYNDLNLGSPVYNPIQSTSSNSVTKNCGESSEVSAFQRDIYYTCDICHMKVFKRKAYIKHVQSHDEEGDEDKLSDLDSTDTNFSSIIFGSLFKYINQGNEHTETANDLVQTYTTLNAKAITTSVIREEVTDKDSIHQAMSNNLLQQTVNEKDVGSSFHQLEFSNSSFQQRDSGESMSDVPLQQEVSKEALNANGPLPEIGGEENVKANDLLQQIFGEKMLNDDIPLLPTVVKKIINYDVPLQQEITEHMQNDVSPLQQTINEKYVNDIAPPQQEVTEEMLNDNSSLQQRVDEETVNDNVPHQQEVNKEIINDNIQRQQEVCEGIIDNDLLQQTVIELLTDDIRKSFVCDETLEDDESNSTSSLVINDGNDRNGDNEFESLESLVIDDGSNGNTENKYESLESIQNLIHSFQPEICAISEVVTDAGINQDFESKDADNHVYGFQDIQIEDDFKVTRDSGIQQDDVQNHNDLQPETSQHDDGVHVIHLNVDQISELARYENIVFVNEETIVNEAGKITSLATTDESDAPVSVEMSNVQNLVSPVMLSSYNNEPVETKEQTTSTERRNVKRKNNNSFHIESLGNEKVVIEQAALKKLINMVAKNQSISKPPPGENAEPKICGYCMLEFSTKRDLLIHLQQFHTENNLAPKVCGFCSDIFQNKRTLQEHIYLMHKTNMLAKECRICGEQFKSVDALNRHARKHEDSKGYQCNLCGLTFRGAQTLIFHLSNGHPNGSSTKLLSCLVCNKAFLSEEKFEAHILRVHQKSKSLIDQCSQNITEVQSNIITSSTEGMDMKNIPYKFRCLKCEKSFIEEADVLAHLYVHHLGDFKCNTCPKKFKYESVLNRHVLKHSVCKNRRKVKINNDCVHNELKHEQDDSLIMNLVNSTDTKNETAEDMVIEDCVSKDINKNEQEDSLIMDIFNFTNSKNETTGDMVIEDCVSKEVKKNEQDDSLVKNIINSADSKYETTGDVVIEDCVSKEIKKNEQDNVLIMDIDNSTDSKKQMTEPICIRTAPLICLLCDITFKCRSDVKDHLLKRHLLDQRDSESKISESEIICIFCLIPIEKQHFESHLDQHLAMLPNQEKIKEQDQRNQKKKQKNVPVITSPNRIPVEKQHIESHLEQHFAMLPNQGNTKRKKAKKMKNDPLRRSPNRNNNNLKLASSNAPISGTFAKQSLGSRVKVSDVIANTACGEVTNHTFDETSKQADFSIEIANLNDVSDKMSTQATNTAKLTSQTNMETEHYVKVVAKVADSIDLLRTYLQSNYAIGASIILQSMQDVSDPIDNVIEQSDTSDDFYNVSAVMKIKQDDQTYDSDTNNFSLNIPMGSTVTGSPSKYESFDQTNVSGNIAIKQANVCNQSANKTIAKAVNSTDILKTLDLERDHGGNFIDQSDKDVDFCKSTAITKVLPHYKNNYNTSGDNELEIENENANFHLLALLAAEELENSIRIVNNVDHEQTDNNQGEYIAVLKSNHQAVQEIINDDSKVVEHEEPDTWMHMLMNHQSENPSVKTEFSSSGMQDDQTSTASNDTFTTEAFDDGQTHTASDCISTPETHAGSNKISSLETQTTLLQDDQTHSESSNNVSPEAQDTYFHDGSDTFDEIGTKHYVKMIAKAVNSTDMLKTYLDGSNLHKLANKVESSHSDSSTEVNDGYQCTLVKYSSKKDKGDDSQIKLILSKKGGTDKESYKASSVKAASYHNLKECVVLLHAIDVTKVLTKLRANTRNKHDVQRKRSANLPTEKGINRQRNANKLSVDENREEVQHPHQKEKVNPDTVQDLSSSSSNLSTSSEGSSNEFLPNIVTSHTSITDILEPFNKNILDTSKTDFPKPGKDVSLALNRESFKNTVQDLSSSSSNLSTSSEGSSNEFLPNIVTSHTSRTDILEPFNKNILDASKTDFRKPEKDVSLALNRESFKKSFDKDTGKPVKVDLVGEILGKHVKFNKRITKKTKLHKKYKSKQFVEDNDSDSNEITRTLQSRKRLDNSPMTNKTQSYSFLGKYNQTVTTSFKIPKLTSEKKKLLNSRSAVSMENSPGLHRKTKDAVEQVQADLMNVNPFKVPTLSERKKLISAQKSRELVEELPDILDLIEPEYPEFLDDIFLPTDSNQKPTSGLTSSTISNDNALVKSKSESMIETSKKKSTENLSQFQSRNSLTEDVLLSNMPINENRVNSIPNVQTGEKKAHSHSNNQAKLSIGNDERNSDGEPTVDNLSLQTKLKLVKTVSSSQTELKQAKTISLSQIELERAKTVSSSQTKLGRAKTVSSSQTELKQAKTISLSQTELGRTKTVSLSQTKLDQAKTVSLSQTELEQAKTVYSSQTELKQAKTVSNVNRCYTKTKKSPIIQRRKSIYNVNDSSMCQQEKSSPNDMSISIVSHTAAAIDNNEHTHSHNTKMHALPFSSKVYETDLNADHDASLSNVEINKDVYIEEKKVEKSSKPSLLSGNSFFSNLSNLYIKSKQKSKVFKSIKLAKTELKKNNNSQTNVNDKEKVDMNVKNDNDKVDTNINDNENVNTNVNDNENVNTSVNDIKGVDTNVNNNDILSNTHLHTTVKVNACRNFSTNNKCHENLHTNTNKDDKHVTKVDENKYLASNDSNNDNLATNVDVSKLSENKNLVSIGNENENLATNNDCNKNDTNDSLDSKHLPTFAKGNRKIATTVSSSTNLHVNTDINEKVVDNQNVDRHQCTNSNADINVNDKHFLGNIDDNQNSSHKNTHFVGNVVVNRHGNNNICVGFPILRLVKCDDVNFNVHRVCRKYTAGPKCCKKKHLKRTHSSIATHSQSEVDEPRRQKNSHKAILSEPTCALFEPEKKRNCRSKSITRKNVNLKSS